MDERDRDQLERMVVHAEAAIGYKRAGGRAWWKDPRTFDAVTTRITRITQVGEAATKVSATTAAGFPGVQWVQIRNTRHRIVHDYMNTDVQIMREIVTRELPALVRGADEDTSAAGTREVHPGRFVPGSTVVASLVP